MIKVMMSAGEVSGDVHGAALAQEINKLNQSIKLFGMGGEKMRMAGVNVRYDLSARGTVGIIEIFKHLPYILYGLHKMKRLMKAERPDLLVLIDYQGFNMMLASYAKKLGIPTAYYIPPQEWLWGTDQGVKKVASTITKILSIFENEAGIYKEAGGNVVYVGNPNIDTTKPSMTKEDFCKAYRLNPKFPIFGLFPGSRIQELDSLLPVLLDTASVIRRNIPNAQFVMSLASEHFRERVENMLKRSTVQVNLIYGKNYDVLSSSNVAIAASGTTIMEAAILGTPVIMIYKLSPLSYFIGKKIIKIRLAYYCMPNLLLNEEAVPELIQSAVTADRLASLSVKLLTDKQSTDNMKDAFRRVRQKLGRPGAVKRAAEEIISELRGKI